MGFWSELFGCNDFKQNKNEVKDVIPQLTPKKKYTNETLEKVYEKQNILMHNEDSIIFITPYYDKNHYQSILLGKKFTASYYNKKSLLLEKSCNFNVDYVLGELKDGRKTYVIKSSDSEDMHEILTNEEYDIENLFQLYNSNKVMITEELKRLIFIFLSDYVNILKSEILSHDNCKYGHYYFSTKTNYSLRYHISMKNYETTVIDTKKRIYNKYFYAYDDNFKEYVIENYQTLKVEIVDYNILEKFEDIVNETVSKEIDEINSKFDEIISDVMYDYDLINKHLVKGANDKLTPLKSLDDFNDFIKLKGSYDFTGLKNDKKAIELLNNNHSMFIERVKFTFNF